MICPGWIANSRKARIAISTIALIVLTRVAAKFGLSAENAAEITTALKVLSSVWIGAIALEDHGKPSEQSAGEASDYEDWLTYGGVADLPLKKSPAAVSSPKNPQPPQGV